MSERRKHDRIRASLPVEIKGKKAKSETVDSKLINISESGAKFYFNEEVNVGSRIKITIDDFDNVLAGKLGYTSKNPGPRKYLVDGLIIRAESRDQDVANQKVAIRFSRLLKFEASEISLN